MNALGSSGSVTARGTTATLYSFDQTQQKVVSHGEQLSFTGQLEGGYVQVGYLGQQWYTNADAVEPWIGGGPAVVYEQPTMPVYQANNVGYAQPQYAQPQYAQPLNYGMPQQGMDHPCSACGRSFGVGRACQFCLQVAGLPNGIHVATLGKRFGAYLLEGVLMLFTLYIGWIIWSLFVWGKGQSPAKQLLNMRVVKVRTGTTASWGDMFLREFVGKYLIGAVVSLTFVGIVYYLWPLWDKDKQGVWDKLGDTLVVNDPNRQLLPQPATAVSFPQR